MGPVKGVQTISLPVPFELGSVNVHLIDLDEGYLMVDAGHGTAVCLAALEEGLLERGIEWGAIRRLFLTHSHPDHIGLAGQIVERSGARVMMNALEAEQAATIVALARPPAFEEAMRLAGVPVALKEDMLRDLEHNRGDYHVISDFQPMEGGDRISVRHGVLEVVWTPGHTLGHLCLFSPEQEYLISGDHLLKAITPNISWRPEEDMLAHYLNSVELVKELKADWILPSHGKPFQGHVRLGDDLVVHHDERCKQILSYLAEGALTAHGVVLRMWARGLTPVHHHFGVMEVLSHLEYLRRRGPVVAELRGAALEWAPLA